MLFGRHQKETILNLMPDGFKDIAKQSAGSVRGDMIPVPDQDKHVFCRVLADRGYVEMNNAGWVNACIIISIIIIIILKQFSKQLQFPASSLSNNFS